MAPVLLRRLAAAEEQLPQCGALTSDHDGASGGAQQRLVARHCAVEHGGGGGKAVVHHTHTLTGQTSGDCRLREVWGGRGGEGGGKDSRGAIAKEGKSRISCILRSAIKSNQDLQCRCVKGAGILL